MRVIDKIRQSDFYIKLTCWEYWPFGIVQFPLFLYWFWLSIRAKSLLFFSASNPGIFMGGMFGESKYDILKKIPEQVKPKTIFIKIPQSVDQTLAMMKESGMEFPVICKPDLGERGFMVKRIANSDELRDYINQIRIDFIIQDCVDLPLEFGVYYVRFPNEDKGKVTSIVAKEMLTVTGDGNATLQQLILAKPRARFQWERLRIMHAQQLNRVLPASEEFVLNKIGNHCLGTKFLDGSYLITEQLNESFDRISKQIDGFYFGRFDLRCESEQALQEGRVKILELNGCGAEPAHIYQPGYPLSKALGVLFAHWKNLFTVSVQNHKRGVPYLSLREGIRAYKKFKSVVS